MRRRRRQRTPEQQAYELAAVDMLKLFGRKHPDTYPPAKLRKLVVADVCSGIHVESQAHQWFMVRAVGRIAEHERKTAEKVTGELLAEAEHRRPGVTL